MSGNPKSKIQIPKSEAAPARHEPTEAPKTAFSPPPGPIGVCRMRNEPTAPGPFRPQTRGRLLSSRRNKRSDPRETRVGPS